MAGFPYDVKVEVAFDHPASFPTPTWTDITSACQGFQTRRGRNRELDVCQPGTLSVDLDNTDGSFDPDNTAGPFYGKLRPNRRVRISAQITEFTSRVYLATGYVDQWGDKFVGEGPYSRTTLTATDRFKLLGKRTNTGLTVAEDATARWAAILNGVGLSSPDYSLNPDGHFDRLLVAHPYERTNTAQALNEVAHSDGGLIFCDGAGLIVGQTWGYRTGATRAAVSQATFGNTTGAIGIEADLSPTVDDDLMANVVRITDGNGLEHEVSDAAAIAQDDRLEYDLGSTLLTPDGALDRANALLAARKDPQNRFESISIDALTGDDQLQHALAREISDRLTVARLVAGGPGTSSRDQHIESVEHRVRWGRDAEWRTTWSLTAA